MKIFFSLREVNTGVSGLSPKVSTADGDADLNEPTISTKVAEPTVVVSTGEGDSNDFESVEISNKAQKILGIDSRASSPEVNAKLDLKDVHKLKAKKENEIV